MDTRPILVVDDDEEMRKAIEDTLHRKGYATVSTGNGKEALERIDSGGLRLVVTDIRMPEMDGMALLREARKRSPALPFLLVTAFGTVSQAVEAVKEGAVDYLLKPFTAEVLLEKVGSTQPQASPVKEDSGLVTQDPAMLEILEMSRGIAGSDVTVVITGESGTGKELVARAIHHNSTPEQPFVAVNCSAIVPTLMESELWGHERGAFTGAHQRKIGRMELAGSGTLFLDEIGDLSLELQAKLLRVLQEKSFERVGGTTAIPFNARVISATHHRLEALVQEKKFREDLYFRLKVSVISLPPLRERREDIPVLVAHLLKKINRS